MKPKILVLANYDPNHLAHGMGLILNNTYRELSNRTDLDVAYGFIEYDNAARLNIQTGQQRFLFPEERREFRYVRRYLGRFEIARCALGGALQRPEREFLRKVREISGDFDVAIWFGFPWDVLATALPRVCACPLILHGNDSISQAERMRPASSLGDVRRFLADEQERRILRAGYAGHVYVSASDAECVSARLPEECHGSVVSIPNGVDSDVFQPMTAPKFASGAFRLLFCGVMNYGPNVQAARLLLNEILPLLPRNLEVRIVGKDPAQELLELAARCSNALITGPVSNIVAEYQQAHVFVAPIQQAAGMKNKVLEALSCGLPVVTTPAVIQAFSEAPAGLVSAKTGAEFATEILRLYDDPATLRDLSDQARAFAKTRCSWQKRTDALVQYALRCAGKPII